MQCINKLYLYSSVAQADTHTFEALKNKIAA